MFKKIVNKILPKGQFARGVSVLVGGTAMSQILIVLSIPLVTRLYTPEDFGVLAAFTAFLAFFTVIAAARYDLTIPLPKKDVDAANLLALGMVITIFISLVAAIVFFVWPTKIATMINAPVLSKYMWLLPISIFVVALYQLLSKWAVRTKDFKSIAKTRIIQTVSQLVIQFAGYTLGPFALMLGHAVGHGAGAGSLSRKALLDPALKRISCKGMVQQAIRYKQFPVYSTWTALLNTASLQLAPLVFISLFGGAIAGLYALTLRVLTMPSNLIGNAIGSVFLSTAPQAYREGTLASLVKDLHSKLALVGALPLVLLVLFGPELFSYIFGENWRQAGVYAQWMAPWIYLQFQWSPLSMLASVLELQGAALIAQLVTFTVRFGVLSVAWGLGLTADYTIFLFSVVSVFAYLIIMLWFIKKAGVRNTEVLMAKFKYLFFSFLFCLPFYMLFNWFL